MAIFFFIAPQNPINKVHSFIKVGLFNITWTFFLNANATVLKLSKQIFTSQIFKVLAFFTDLIFFHHLSLFYLVVFFICQFYLFIFYLSSQFSLVQSVVCFFFFCRSFSYLFYSSQIMFTFLVIFLFTQFDILSVFFGIIFLFLVCFVFFIFTDDLSAIMKDVQSLAVQVLGSEFGEVT